MDQADLPKAPFLSIAPGRVNLLGEHVDYNDGIVLPAAIDRSVRLAATPSNDSKITLHALDLNETCSFSLDNLEAKQDIQGNPLPSWARYPAGVAWILQQRGFTVRGFEGTFTSNVPMGSGLSSSAAVEVAFAALWQEFGGWAVDRLELAKICQAAENRYVGVNCGLMDQFASANGVKDHALWFDTRSLEFHPVPLPAHTAIVIADSKMRRSLATSAYNDRRAACEEAVRILRAHLPEIRALRDVTPSQFNHYAAELPEIVGMRARHVVEEIARTEEAVQCLENGDADGFGRLMLAGHASLRDLYEVSIPELDALVDIAKNLPGCWGARLTGAGFGGCTVNLVEEDKAEAFIADLKNEYNRLTNHQSEVYLCHASQGVTVSAQ